MTKCDFIAMIAARQSLYDAVHSSLIS